MHFHVRSSLQLQQITEVFCIDGGVHSVFISLLGREIIAGGYFVYVLFG